MSESKSDVPSEPPLRQTEFSVLQTIVTALQSQGHPIADYTGVALDRGGSLKESRPSCWILANARPSMRPPPKPFEGLRAIVLPEKPRRVRIVKLFMRNERHMIVDIYDLQRYLALKQKLVEDTRHLGIRFEENPVNGPGPSEVFKEERTRTSLS